MKNLLVFVICIISFSLYAQVIEEDFETGDFSAYNWVLSGDAEWFISDNNSFAGEYCAQGGNVADGESTTIEISIECPHTGILAFAWKVSSEPSYDFLRFYLDEEMVAEISGTVAWTQLGYELAAGTHTLRWSYEKDYSVSNGTDTGWLDEIYFFTEEEEFDYDLQVTDMSGINHAIADSSYIFEVEVRNNGQFNATGYSVKLVDAAGVEYASETIYWMLAPGDENLVELTFEPAAAIMDTLIGIYGKVELATDENPDNDFSEKMDVHIIGGDCQFAQIGADTTFTSLLPLNFTRHASIYECIYYEEELAATGAISSIDLFNNFSNAIEGIPVNIWLGTTRQTSLNEDWINADQLQQVFSGALDFPAGENTINIILDSLFIYEEDNLVLLMEKEYEEEPHSWQSNFYFSEIAGEESGRTRFGYNDLEGYNPAAISDGIVCDWVANTVFTFIPEPTGAIDGYVYIYQNSQLIPVSEAFVEIASEYWHTETDSTGYFLLENIPAGCYDLYSDWQYHFGYIDDVIVVAGEVTEVEIILEDIVDNDENEVVPSEMISRIYPNPFSPQNSRSRAVIDINLSSMDLPALLNVYDIRGRKVDSRKIMDQDKIYWDGQVHNRPAATGVYLFKLTTIDGREDTARLIIVK